MPNYVYNKLEIKGNYNKVFNQIKGKNGVMDFNKIVPMPFIRSITSQSAVNWAYNNWDTKWNAVNPYIKGNTILFSTAWYPSLKIIEAMSKKFTDASFKITWADEEHYCRTGMAEYQCGRCLKKEEYKDGSEKAKKTYEYVKF
jgi:hypothetical protein